MSERCSKIVPGAGWYRHDCSRKATVERDGKWWCWQHDPEYVAEKRRTEEEKWEADSKNRSAKWDRERRAYAALDALEAAGITNPEAVQHLAALVEPIKKLKHHLSDDGEYCITRADGKPMWVESFSVSDQLEVIDKSLAALTALESDG